MRSILFVWFMVIFAMTALAQSSQGRIVDLNGNGVAGVEIVGEGRCFPSAGALAKAQMSVFSAADGTFTWPETGAPGVGSNCAATLTYSFTLKKDGLVFTRGSFFSKPPTAFPSLYPNYDERLSMIQATGLPSWSGVSAANFSQTFNESIFNVSAQQVLASQMIVAGFGTNLAVTTEVAGLTLPTVLGDRKVLIKDSAGVEKAAKLFFVSPSQINYVAPDGLANGPAQIRLVDGNNNLLRLGLTEIRNVAPGIFTANADGKGVPAGLVVRVKPGNVQSYEPIAQYDERQRRFVPLALDLGAENEALVLALFGTGWRQAASSPVRAIVRKLASDGSVLLSVACPVEYVGAQPTFEGLDQLNVRLPRDLQGSGDVELVVLFENFYVNLTVNTVQLKFK